MLFHEYIYKKYETLLESTRNKRKINTKTFREYHLFRPDLSTKILQTEDTSSSIILHAHSTFIYFNHRRKIQQHSCRSFKIKLNHNLKNPRLFRVNFDSPPFFP